jgi:hypothetical protein
LFKGSQDVRWSNARTWTKILTQIDLYKKNQPMNSSLSHKAPNKVQRQRCNTLTSSQVSIKHQSAIILSTALLKCYSEERKI